MNRQRKQKLQQGAWTVFGLCFAPVLLGCAICLLFFPPTWAVCWLLGRPQFWQRLVGIRLALWKEYWYLRGALRPRQFSSPTLALQKAALTGDVFTAKTLLERGADVNAGPFYGIPLLVRVATGGDTAMVAQLLDAGANIEAAYPVLRYTALRQAAFNDHTDSIVCLLERGANHAALDVYRQDALTIACCQRRDGVVRALLQQFAREETLPLSVHISLRTAKAKGYREIVQMLLEAGVKNTSDTETEQPTQRRRKTVNAQR